MNMLYHYSDIWTVNSGLHSYLQAAEKEKEQEEKHHSGKLGKKFTKNTDKSNYKGKKVSPKMDKSANPEKHVSGQDQSGTVKRKASPLMANSQFVHHISFTVVLLM